jgi:hypothetical protein
LNEEGTMLWMHELEKSSECTDDLEPLDLILWMTKKPAKERPTAQQVLNTIVSFQTALPFYDNCCCKDDDTTRSSQAFPSGFETPELELKDPIQTRPVFEDITHTSEMDSDDKTILAVAKTEDSGIVEVPHEELDHSASSQEAVLLDEVTQDSSEEANPDAIRPTAHIVKPSPTEPQPRITMLAKRDR